MERMLDARGLFCQYDGILAKYSTRKRNDEPGSPARKGGVVHPPILRFRSEVC